MEYNFGSIELSRDESEVAQKAIIKSFQRELSKIDKRIEKIKNNPKNEGQATYLSEINGLRGFRDALVRNIEFLNAVYKNS